jgi:diguanylate cyclase (GGDEF)-like protein/PAS domain S-box-containing protein
MGLDALEALEFEVVAATDGAEAVERFRDDRPDLVLLDVNMPEMDGFAACREMRRSPSGADTPIVIMTASDEMDSVRRAYEAGATDFVTKPVNWTVVAERVRYMLRMGRMVSELRQSREALAEAQQQAGIGSFELDAHGLVHGSAEFWRLYGLEIEEDAVDLGSIIHRVHAEEREPVRTGLARCLASGEPLQIDHRVRGDSGGERFIHLRASVQSSTPGEQGRLRGTAQDVTERRRSEEEIRFLAFHDSLTRLGNRRLFTDRLRFALAQLRRSSQMAAVLFLDLDNFKRINDTLGHEAGDQFLVGVADRLRHCVRDSDCVSRDVREQLSSTVSRFGGDEFLIALCGIDSEDEATLVAQRILEQLERPLFLGNESIIVGASIGIAIAPKDGRDVDTLIRNADVAMYHAKQHGRGHAQFYQAVMTEDTAADFQLEADLRAGIEQEQLFVQYQPTVEVAGGRVTGFEALVRWNHPKRGVILPADFIPLAESSGLIDRIGEFVLREACKQLRSWEDAGMSQVRVAVNVSPKQLALPDFVERFRAIIQGVGVRGSQLDLELTETAMVENPAQTVSALEALKGIGLRVSLDDFGTGYSSLSHLKGFPLDTVKIDRSFVKDLPDDRDDVAVTEAILSMAAALGLRVVAEGVETAEQLEFLRERGCAEAQGYFLRAPSSPEDATELLRSEPLLRGGAKPEN